jgi:hypothetical protein
VPYFLVRKRPQIGRFESLQPRDGSNGLHADEVLHHPDAIFQAARFVYGRDPSVSDRRPHECHFEHARTTYVANELTPAGQKARIFLAAERCANAFARTAVHGCHIRRKLREWLFVIRDSRLVNRE